jgi:hypothetical protein
VVVIVVVVVARCGAVSCHVASGVRAFNWLARGYLVRLHVTRVLRAVSTMQRSSRAFIKRNRQYYAKVKATVLFQVRAC